MQVLTIQEVVKANRVALTNGTLLALHPELAKNKFGDIHCNYEIGNCHCAIGVALNRETLDRVKEVGGSEQNLNYLANWHIVSCDDDSLAYLLKLQQQHDHWLMSKTEEIEENRREFMQVLDEAPV
jgi:hypothetical protein